MPFNGDAERFRRLQLVTDAALAHLELDQLLAELLARIRDALEADTVAILFHDDERNELVAGAAVGLEEEVERGVRIPIDRGFAGRVAGERRPIIVEDVDRAEILNPILREKASRACSASRSSSKGSSSASSTSARSARGPSRPRTSSSSSSPQTGPRSRSRTLAYSRGSDRPGLGSSSFRS